MTNSAALPQPDVCFDPRHVGAVVRNLRIERSWTLRDLAERSGISLSGLSRMETGQSPISLQRARALARAFGLDAVLLLTEMARPSTRPEALAKIQGWRSFTPAGQGERIKQPNATYEYVCSDFLDRRIVGSLVEVTARCLAEHGSMVSEAGEEFVYVIDGPVVFSTLGFADLILKTGDCLQFDSSAMHAFFSGADKAARLLFLASRVRTE